MKNIYLLLLLLSFIFSPVLSALAQNQKIAVTERDYANKEVTMADTFRQEGKIYVVVAVLATIFTGIVVFLIVTETKLKKLEDIVYSEKGAKKAN